MAREVIIKKALPDEMGVLQKICNETYSIYFFNYWENEGLNLYLEDQFGNVHLKADLSNKVIDYYFICLDEVPIGFLKINGEVSFESYNKTDNCELEKMYLYPKYIGTGIGTRALNLLIEKISKEKRTNLIVEVLDTNLNGISFYEKLGFKFHSKTVVKAPHFKQELNGLNRMVLKLSDLA
jgi:GNAT superfamily N-acetyltransferase